MAWGVSSVLRGGLEAWDGGVGGRFKGGGLYLQLTHLVVHQKPAQHCKVIVLQFKNISMYVYIYIYVCILSIHFYIIFNTYITYIYTQIYKRYVCTHIHIH